MHKHHAYRQTADRHDTNSAAIPVDKSTCATECKRKGLANDCRRSSGDNNCPHANYTSTLLTCHQRRSRSTNANVRGTHRLGCRPKLLGSVSAEIGHWDNGQWCKLLIVTYVCPYTNTGLCVICPVGTRVKRANLMGTPPHRLIWDRHPTVVLLGDGGQCTTLTPCTQHSRPSRVSGPFCLVHDCNHSAHYTHIDFIACRIVWYLSTVSAAVSAALRRKVPPPPYPHRHAPADAHVNAPACPRTPARPPSCAFWRVASRSKPCRGPRLRLPCDRQYLNLAYSRSRFGVGAFSGGQSPWLDGNARTREGGARRPNSSSSSTHGRMRGTCTRILQPYTPRHTTHTRP